MTQHPLCAVFFVASLGICHLCSSLPCVSFVTAAAFRLSGIFWDTGKILVKLLLILNVYQQGKRHAKLQTWHLWGSIFSKCLWATMGVCGNWECSFNQFRPCRLLFSWKCAFTFVTSGAVVFLKGWDCFTRISTRSIFRTISYFNVFVSFTFIQLLKHARIVESYPCLVDI